jgi:hypothetical protein
MESRGCVNALCVFSTWVCATVNRLIKGEGFLWTVL